MFIYSNSKLLPSNYMQILLFEITRAKRFKIVHIAIIPERVNRLYMYILIDSKEYIFFTHKDIKKIEFFNIKFTYKFDASNFYLY